jgi:DNA-binding Lrp family transcriptional regulator
LWSQDKAYSDLMQELWGSPTRWNARKTYTDVARKLGVDDETVRNRLRHMKESGFLVGWRLVPNPSLMGRESALLYLEFADPESKQEAISRLARTGGVVIIASVYGSSLLLTLFDDASRALSKRIAGMYRSVKAQTIPGMRFPRSAFRMTVTDWQIVRQMLGDAERRISGVAKEVAVSQRTVKRRLDRMMDSSAIFVMPMINQSRSDGVAYQLMVEGESMSSTEVEKLVAPRIENLVFRAPYSKSGTIFGFYGRNVAEGSELLRWIKAQPGVRSARMSIIEDIKYVSDWLETETERLGGVIAASRGLGGG